MHSHLAQEWAAAWPLPAIAIALLVVLSFLRPMVDVSERGRVKAGIFFTGAYLVATLAFGLLGRPMPTGTQHDWLRVLAVLLLCFAMVIAGSLLVFDLVLRRRQLPRILQDLVQAVAYFIVAAIVLTRSDVDVTRVFTASVLTTAVLGLALQDTLGNIMSGLALQLERDFEVGDWINLGDRAAPIVGRIREVRWRATTIITRDGDLVLIPNSAITRAMITNYSRPTTAHRQWVTVRVHFRHPPARVRDVIVEAVRGLSFVRAEPSPDCLLQEFREDACTYSCRYWIDDVQRTENLDGDVRSAIWYALHRAGMEIPFPSRNINVTEMNE
ncbi:MAG TPA: mechanosensitive ion channel family protein, partial [Polyangia bacterium]